MNIKSNASASNALNLMVNHPSNLLFGGILKSTQPAASSSGNNKPQLWMALFLNITQSFTIIIEHVHSETAISHFLLGSSLVVFFLILIHHMGNCNLG